MVVILYVLCQASGSKEAVGAGPCLVHKALAGSCCQAGNLCHKHLVEPGGLPHLWSVLPGTCLHRGKGPQQHRRVARVEVFWPCQPKPVKATTDLRSCGPYCLHLSFKPWMTEVGWTEPGAGRLWQNLKPSRVIEPGPYAACSCRTRFP